MGKIIIGFLLLSVVSLAQINNSSWDGSVNEVKQEIKNMVNDPGSVEYYGWGEVTATDTNQIVWCDFGAKNQYGGMVRMEYWFVFDLYDNYVGCFEKE